MHSPPPLSQRNYPLAAVLALFAFTIWVVSDALLKTARVHGVSLGQILFICGTWSMAVIFMVSLLRGKAANLRPHYPPGLIVLGLCQIVAFIFWMLAVPHLPFANMYVVPFLTPLVVAGMAALFLKEKLGWKRALAIGIGFAGVVVAVHPSTLFQANGERLSYLFLFCHTLGIATQMFMLRAIVSKEEKCEATAFYPRGIVAFAGLFMCMGTGLRPMEPWIFFILCLSGALGGAGWAILAKAYKNAPAAAVTPFQYSQIITSALLGYFIWGDIPSLYLIIGSAIIIASGLWLIRQERRVSRMLVRGE